MNKLASFLLLCVCSIFAQAVSAEGPSFDAMYVFGDSLSDNGNDLILTKLLRLDPAIPPSESPHRTYFQGRFSNGPISFEYLWRSIKKSENARVVPSLAFAQPGKNGAINYAFGGATSGLLATTPGGFSVPGLLGQVEAFRFGLLGRKPVRRALYAIWIGSNDYITPVPVSPLTAVSNIKRSIQRLYGIGGRHFMVLNLPNLGLIPAAQAQPQPIRDFLTAVSGIHNTLLAQVITELSTTLPGIKITSMDVFTLAQNLRNGLTSPFIDVPALEVLAPGLLDPPASFCLLVNPARCPDLVSLTLTAQQPFLFWDVEHPTTFVHGKLGQAMYEALQQ
jgi:phospholipase/lecithinase/hemolysin